MEYSRKIFIEDKTTIEILIIMKKANPRKIKGGKTSWKKYRKEWFKSEKKFKEKLEKEGCEILVYKGGYPDFMYQKGGKIIFAEIKKGKDRLSNKQKGVLTNLKEKGFKVIVYRYKSGKFEEDRDWEVKNAVV